MQPKTCPSILLICALIIFSASACLAKTVYVKWDSPGTGDPVTYDGASWASACHKIGDAIPKAVPGDEIWVAAGTYDNMNVSINQAFSLYGGFAGTETSRDQRDWNDNVTIIDGGRNGNCVSIMIPDGTTGVVDGFTMQNTLDAVQCSGGSPTISHNKFLSLTWAGVNVNGSATITNNIVLNCGEGIRLGVNPTSKITNNTIIGSYKGICFATGNPTITNNIIAFGTYGIYQYGAATYQLSHNDVFGNKDTLGTPHDYYGSMPGATDMSVDPMLVDRVNGDCHLNPESPCVNAGDNSAQGMTATDMDGENRVFMGLVDIGADEVVAPQTACPAFVPAGNGVVFPVDVTIKSATDGAVIRYTTNGLEPGTSDAVVSGPVTLSGPGTIKAKAWKTGMIPSAIVSVDYVAGENLVASIKTKALNQTVTTDHAVISHLVHKDYFYIESDDRSSGIQVFKLNHGMQAGMRVRVTGTLMLTGVEKYIKATSIVQNGAGTILPLIISNRDIGGGDWKYNSSTKAGQVGVKEYRQVKTGGTWTPTLLSVGGVNNIGLLVATTGRVTYVGAGFFYIDDGSGLMDADNYAAGYKGLRILGTVPVDAGVDPIGKLVRVTGSVSCLNRSGNGYRQVYARDVEILQ